MRGITFNRMEGPHALSEWLYHYICDHIFIRQLTGGGMG